MKSSLSYSILENITEDIFWRGFDYFKKHKVGEIKESEKNLISFVHGSGLYTVEFRQGAKYLKAYCDCPYFRSNKDYCKHIAAVAIARDSSKNLQPPSEKEVSELAIEVISNFSQKINQMFEHPLKADLEFLAKASNYSSWTRPHAQIPLNSAIKLVSLELTRKEVVNGLAKIKRLANIRRYDMYFCAGEISSVFAKSLDATVFRISFTPLKIAIEVFKEVVKFYYENYLQMIDGSDGIWQIPQARLLVIFSLLKEKGVSKDESIELKEYFNRVIEGWGDIFEDIGIQLK